MMYLKRIIDPNECIWCKTTNQTLGYGAYYYEDDIDGFVIDAIYYKKLKDTDRYREYYETKMAKRQDMRSYAQALRQAEKDFLMDGLLDREVYKGDK